MALKTLGTNGTTTLNALVAGTDLTPADIAQVRANIKNDLLNSLSTPGSPVIWPGAFEFENGLLYIPRRGVLKVESGDYVAYDAFGWPILVSKYSIAYGSTSWTHS